MDRMDIRLIRERERLEGWSWEVVGLVNITGDNAGLTSDNTRYHYQNKHQPPASACEERSRGWEVTFRPHELY